MSDTPSSKSLRRVKTGALERRFSMAKASMIAGARFAAASAGSMFADADERGEIRRKAMQEQAEYLVEELGKLKGSIVKIGQMMALYGEHFLPAEITSALHQLNDSTIALEWPAVEAVLQVELGPERLAELEVDPKPLGAASLGQVHRAVRKSDGQQVCLKIQYPGVADAVDSDLDLVTRMLRLTKAVPQTREFEEWLEEVRMMMHREVNYPLEMETTRRFHDLLKGDDRYIVPKVFPEYSTAHILCTSYEPGLAINSTEVLALPQWRRNHLAEGALDICCKEIFEWGEIQTDPNFGNYLVRLGNGDDVPDRIVCLDFGAVRDFPEDLMNLARNMSRAAFFKDMEMMVAAMTGFTWFEKMSRESKERFGKLAFLAIEPFSDLKDAPPETLNAEGAYCWAKSNLHVRAVAAAAKNSVSTEFSAPPKEFMFVSRKFMGAYTFMTVIDAQIRAREILRPYVEKET